MEPWGRGHCCVTCRKRHMQGAAACSMPWAFAERILGLFSWGPLEKSLLPRTQKAQPYSHLLLSVGENSCFLWVLFYTKLGYSIFPVVIF